jgi:hypothetical protein
MDESESSPWRTTLLVVMLAITATLVLTGVVLLVDVNGKRIARQSECGKNQSQLLGACVAYSVSEGVAWPLPWPYVKKGDGTWDPPAIALANAHQARLASARAMEILAVASGPLPNSLFACRQARLPGPVLKAAADARNGDRWGADTVNAVSYAFDWASPDDPDSGRVILADRDPQNHKGTVMACFGDSHVKKLKVVPGTAEGMVTENSDGSPVRAIVSDLMKDQSGYPGNIFSPDGDDDGLVGTPYAPLTPLGGSPTRAWVK